MLLQKKDSEGFGFVLRGAKGKRTDLFSSSHTSFKYTSCHFCSVFLAQTPIEEFTPTPAFPALQYLESVDEGGVAWRAGLRMGDFLIEVKCLHLKQ